MGACRAQVRAPAPFVSNRSKASRNSSTLSECMSGISAFAAGFRAEDITLQQSSVAPWAPCCSSRFFALIGYSVFPLCKGLRSYRNPPRAYGHRPCTGDHVQRAAIWVKPIPTFQGNSSCALPQQRPPCPCACGGIFLVDSRYVSLCPRSSGKELPEKYVETPPKISAARHSFAWLEHPCSCSRVARVHLYSVCNYKESRSRELPRFSHL